MAREYDDRQIWNVTVDVGRAFEASRTENAKRTLGVTVAFSLKARHMDAPGPEATLSFGMDDMPGATLDIIEEAAIARALALMGRFVEGGVAEATKARDDHDALQLKPYEFKLPGSEE